MEEKDIRLGNKLIANQGNADMVTKIRDIIDGDRSDLGKLIEVWRILVEGADVPLPQRPWFLK